MSELDHEAIATFMDVANVSEATAIEKLQEHLGNLNDAIHAYMFEIDRDSVASHSETQENSTGIIDAPPVECQSPGSSLFSSMKDSTQYAARDGTKDGSKSSKSSSPTSGDMSDCSDDDEEEIYQAAIDKSPKQNAAILDKPSEDLHGCGTSTKNKSTLRKSLKPVRMSRELSAGDSPNSVEGVKGSPTSSPFLPAEDLLLRAAQHSEYGSKKSGPSSPEFPYFPYFGDDVEEEMLQSVIEASLKTAEQEKLLRELIRKDGSNSPEEPPLVTNKKRHLCAGTGDSLNSIKEVKTSEKQVEEGEASNPQQHTPEDEIATTLVPMPNDNLQEPMPNDNQQE